ncbi:MAG: AAA family ATPase [Deltaproteobacteria bacterium]|nr:AAA family ATPase [Deltaproteobacteria bacterium]
MYKEFFALKENPFKLSPDLRYYFLCPRIKRVMDQLFYGLDQNMGFMLVTGEIGVGKTSMLRFFMSHLDDSVERAYLFNPTLGSSEELLSFLIMDLKIGNGVPSQSNKIYLLSQIHQYLLDRYAEGKKVLFIIDDAQAIPDFLLEELRLLSNFETDQDKLFQIILVGQRELGDRLRRNNLRQLNQRIPIKTALFPFSKEETAAYISYRLMVAGGNGIVFKPKAIDLIQRESRGLPRLVNLIAERTLIAGYVKGAKELGKKEVKMALKDLEVAR